MKPPISDAEMEVLRARIAAILVKHVEPIFTQDYLLTILCRVPGKPTRTVIVSNDDPEIVLTPLALESTARTHQKVADAK